MPRLRYSPAKGITETIEVGWEAIDAAKRGEEPVIGEKDGFVVQLVYDDALLVCISDEDQGVNGCWEVEAIEDA